MATAFYPLGMKTYNNHTNQGGYKSWKGNGTFSNPTGITAGNIRPFTNKDPTNNSYTGFGLPRPIKQYRKGRVIPNNINGVFPTGTGGQVVKSSLGGSLIKQMIDMPGNYNIFQNTINETSNISNLNNECINCNGIGVISDWMPITNLTEKPQEVTQTQKLCCNAEKKATVRCLPTSSNIKINGYSPTCSLTNNYFSNLQQYRQNRCQTYDQRVFNFTSVADYQLNTYNAKCSPSSNQFTNVSNNPCPSTNSPSNVVVYKQNNPQFAQQGAVKSSLRTFKLAVENTTTFKIAKTTKSGRCSIFCPIPPPPPPPIICGEINLSSIAIQGEDNTWTLNQNTTISECQTLIIPIDNTLIISSGITLTNNGIINNAGTIINNE